MAANAGFGDDIAALGKEFPQKDELTLARENHGAVIRELQRMQDDSNYVSTWEPKKSLIVEPPILAESAEQNRESAAAVTNAVQSEAKQFHTLTFGDGEGRTEPSPISTMAIPWMAMSCAVPILAVRSVPWGKVSTRTANGTALRIRRRE